MLPDPCSLVTVAAAQNILNVKEVQANPANSGPESLNPRCAYRDGEQLGRFVSLVVVRAPASVFNSALPADELGVLASQSYGYPRSPYEAVGSGPGKHRFVAETDDSATMFVMPGLGLFGGTYDQKTIGVEAAYVVTLRDPERSEEERLDAVRKLAAEYNSVLTGVARKR